MYFFFFFKCVCMGVLLPFCLSVLVCLVPAESVGPLETVLQKVERRLWVLGLEPGSAELSLQPFHPLFLCPDHHKCVGIILSRSRRGMTVNSTNETQNDFRLALPLVEHGEGPRGVAPERLRNSPVLQLYWL